jgi:RNA polymerase sigma-70 factor (ECF subfamily)
MGIVSLVPSSEQLAVRAANGDRRAFEALVSRHARPLYVFCARLLGDATEAEDRVQEAFLRAYTNLGRFNPSYRFSSWLTKIAQNTCIDALRARKAWTSIDDLEPVAEAKPLTFDHADQLDSAMSELPAKFRAVLHCKYGLGMNSTEIGRELDMTPQNVRVSLHRAIKTLRLRMSP